MGGGKENDRGRMTQKSIKEGKKTAVDDCGGGELCTQMS